MNAGELRHRIRIERATTTLNAAGEGVVGEWTTIADVYASIRPASQREMMLTQDVQAQATHAVTIRFPMTSARPTASATARARSTSAAS